VSLIRKESSGNSVIQNDFYFSPTHKKIHTDIIAPIKNEGDKTIAVLIFGIDPNDYLYPLIQSWPTPSKTAESLILKKDGDSIVYLNELRHTKNSTLQLRIPLTNQSNPGVQAVLRGEGFVEGIDYRGLSVSAYVAPIPHTAWFLEAKVDHAEMYAELYFRTALIVIITIVLILLMWASLAIFYRSRQKNIYHALFIKEKELRESFAAFKTILYSIGDGVITTDRTGRVKILNQTASALTGWNEADAVGKPIADVFRIVNEVTRLTVENPLSTVLTEGAIVGLANHTLLVSKDGKETPIADSGAPIRDERGEIDGAVLVFRDKTEERDAERTIQKSAEKYRIVADNTSDWEFWVNTHGEFLYNSPACHRTTGYDASIFLDDPGLFMRIINEADRPALERHWIECDMKQIPGVLEFRIVRADGGVRWIEHACSPVFDDAGTFLGSRGCNRDITERKLAEENLRRIEERLRQSEKMEAVGQLAGGIAHEFNNVLGGIIGFTDLSMRLADKDSLLEKNLLKVLKAADRAKQLVTHILAFTRHGNPHRSVTALKPLVEEVLELLKSSIPSSVIIQAELQSETKAVLADTSQLQQVLLNLAANAVHAMNRKGTLTLRLYGTDVHDTEYGRSGKIDPGAYTVIEVTDTGCGMNETTLAKAFEPFFTTKGVGEGTGMGLSVVLGIVQSHDGDIQVESEVGKGTTIRILLHAVEEPAAEATVDHAQTLPVGTERILFVDDEQMLVEIAERSLTRLGYAFTGMTDSVKALAYFKENEPSIDILVTDQTMPGMTGIELAEEVLKIRKNLPIILCTGNSRDMAPTLTDSLHIKQIVMKPYSPREIGKAIRGWIDSTKDENV
jgi:PAS domain S-box-containing protein